GHPCPAGWTVAGLQCRQPVYSWFWCWSFRVRADREHGRVHEDICWQTPEAGPHIHLWSFTWGQLCKWCGSTASAMGGRLPECCGSVTWTACIKRPVVPGSTVPGCLPRLRPVI